MKWILILLATSNVQDDSSYEKSGEYDNLKLCMVEAYKQAKIVVDLMDFAKEGYKDPVELEKVGLVCIREDKFKLIENHFNKK